MKRLSPIGSKYVMCGLLAGLSFLCHTLSAADPIFDAVAVGGKVVDNSTFQRAPKGPKLTPGSDENAVIFTKNTSVRIPFDEQDALYAPGPWTWIVRCKFERVLLGEEDIFIASRWEGAGNQRIMVLCVDGKSGKGRLQVSATGALDSMASVQSKSPIPEGEWITLVARFVPGKELTLQIFTAGGEMVDSVVRSKNVPDQLPGFPLPFIIGRAIPADMEFARFRAWNDALSDGEIQEVVAEK